MFQLKKIFQWLVFGSKGGKTRLLILRSLQDNPKNANSLAKDLGMDYKTIKHHIEMMQKNQLINVLGEGYGKAYFVNELLFEDEKVKNMIIGDENEK